jgi:threonine synthase
MTRIDRLSGPLHMHYISTRNADHPVKLGEAIARGIAPDGGLYVPQDFPHFVTREFDTDSQLPQIAERLLAPFAAGDPLAAELPAICNEAFDFPAPLVGLPNAPAPLSVLELFHGPTSAFKDFGARFLAASMERIRRGQKRKLTMLVATSGDTGGAVAAAFHGKPWVDVAVLYPHGRVSELQAHQLACWGGNIRTFAVRGSFDDCQRIVKEAFADPALAETHQLSSANSINIGRLLPQMVYFAKAGLELWRESGRRANFIVPTGNLGNALACIWARHIGVPIGEIVLATNANQSITEYLRTGEWAPRRRHRDPWHDPSRLARARPPVVSAQRHGRQSLPPAAGARRPRPLGYRRDGASGEVQRDRRGADRSRCADAGEPGAVAGAAAPGTGTRPDARGVA